VGRAKGFVVPGSLPFEFSEPGKDDIFKIMPLCGIFKALTGDFAWTTRSSARFDAVWERPKAKWPSYSVSLPRPYRVLSRDGEKSL